MHKESTTFPCVNSRCNPGVQALSQDYESEKNVTRDARQAIADLESRLADSQRLLAAETAANNDSKNALERKLGGVALPSLVAVA